MKKNLATFGLGVVSALAIVVGAQTIPGPPATADQWQQGMLDLKGAMPVLQAAHGDLLTGRRLLERLDDVKDEILLAQDTESEALAVQSAQAILWELSVHLESELVPSLQALQVELAEGAPVMTELLAGFTPPLPVEEEP